jgi:hypothetical protein
VRNKEVDNLFIFTVDDQVRASPFMGHVGIEQFLSLDPPIGDPVEHPMR